MCEKGKKTQQQKKNSVFTCLEVKHSVRERRNITIQPLAESTGLNNSKYALTVIVKK